MSMNNEPSLGPHGGDCEHSMWNGFSDGHDSNTGNTWQAVSPSKYSLPPQHVQNIRSPLAFATGLPSLSPYAILANVKTLLHRSRPPEMLMLPSPTNRCTHRPLTSAPQSSTASTLRFMFLCIIWYTTSALSSNTGKTILIRFSYPVTLTIIQFGFVAAYCVLFMTPAINFSKLRPPTASILRATLPMGAFQVGGHMFSSMAISRIPVATVHTIKAISPLVTVAAYAFLFGVKYSPKTYVSLLPLTAGVMLACTFDVSASSPIGFLCAFGSALVFVSSNIFFKKVMPSGSQTSPHKLDKLNLLLYSSGAAFILMIPLWSFTDLPRLLAVLDDPTHIIHPSHSHISSHSLTYHFILNGTVHFAQNIIAFVILSSTSPVTYSIASLIKRVWVICMAVVWFNQSVHPIQGLGIGMTFVGLYMYNAAKGDVEWGENKIRRVEAARNMMLPSNRAEEKLLNGSVPSSPPITEFNVSVAATTGMGSRSQVPLPSTGNVWLQAQDVLGQPQPRNLRITIIPAESPLVFTKRGSVIPPHPYPSPPASLDSPPSHTVPLGHSMTVYPAGRLDALGRLSAESMCAAQVTA